MVVSPHDLLSSSVVVRLTAKLTVFVQAHRLGFVFESNGGFRYDDGDMMAPDVSFISRERLPSVPRSFARAVPELVVEVQSSTQRPSAVRAKLALLLEKGSTLGLLIDPGTRSVEVHRPGSSPIELRDGDAIDFAEVLPGLHVAVSDLWPESY
ncbi:MAG: Uma2 family endonuclease [Vulcanimicrobiaceae bacterium]